MTVSMEKADISKAYQVLLLISDLAPSERKVGGILLKHFNRKSGRCDPSINRIAEFAGLDRSTVINATKSLVARGLFQKIVHGGRNQTNLYQPNWPEIRSHINEIESRMYYRVGAAVESSVKVGKSPSRGSDITCRTGRANATQTLRRTHMNRTLQKNTQNRTRDGAGDWQSKNETNSDYNETSKARISFCGEQGRKPSVSRYDAARDSAIERIVRTLRIEHPRYFLDKFPFLSDELIELAIKKEMAAKGAGIKFILGQ